MTRPKPLEVVAEVRPYPASIEAERAILGAVLQWPDLVLPRLPDLRGCWYRRDHEELWGLLLEMVTNGEPIDLVTVPTRVGRSETPAKYGGVASVTELPDHAPAWANVTHYAAMVVRDAALRKLIAACDEAMSRAYTGREDPDTIAADLIAALPEAGEW